MSLETCDCSEVRALTVVKRSRRYLTSFDTLSEISSRVKNTGYVVLLS